MLLIKIAVFSALVTFIIGFPATLIYSTPYIILVTKQSEKNGKSYIYKDLKSTLKMATMLYTSPFTGKKPPIF